MVRMKRKRRRMLFFMAAACVACAAVLLLLIIGLVLKFRSRGESRADNEDHFILREKEQEPENEGPEGSVQKADPVAEQEKEPHDIDEEGVSEDSAPSDLPEIDDDSLQDENSVVDTEMTEEEWGQKRVYLTFDDGPSVYTDEILDILKSYGVNATFFVCGTGDTNESLRHVYKRITDEGNTIGMHSYSHVYSKVYGNLDLFQYDLDKIRNLIYNETGVVPKYYRFPGGSGNTIASLPMGQYISVLYSQGMEYYDWNVYCGDSSGKRISSKAIIKNTLDGVDRRRTAVVLLHDTGSTKSTVEALPGILEGLKDRGLDIRPIDDETPPLHQFDEAGGLSE